jgi:hypothetical protein
LGYGWYYSLGRTRCSIWFRAIVRVKFHFKLGLGLELEVVLRIVFGFGFWVGLEMTGVVSSG